MKRESADVRNEGLLVVSRAPNLSGMICANDDTGQEQGFKVRVGSPPPRWCIPKASCKATNFSIKRSALSIIMQCDGV